MSLKSNFPNIHQNSPLTPPRNLSILHRRTSQIRLYRVWRRRRLKNNLAFEVRNQLGPLQFENLFEKLVYQFPSVNSLDLIAPALGFFSGVALYLSRFQLNHNSDVSDIGEWILFTSPTPFNRFVMLRCPSISFEGSELLEDVDEKLVEEDRHFVRLNRGRIQVRNSDDRGSLLEEKLVYQRVCVSTDDGGVISLDWPATLDLKEERGLDTTLLLVPGTAEGSVDRNVRSFVLECLKRGCFPVVMNPRGCAGSPLTTARLFTAADSDDICNAIQFINRARPWTTLMGVGWGYGANMLTKYLAEVGEKTPLTAATCIDNPFDLEEATRSSPHHIAVDQKLTGGLIDILQSNKELFQGRAKGFDVKKALSAKSVRDFEKEISMVSYGFDAIEDFYAKSSTRGVIGNVKIPVLFIQTDDGTVPLFSIPRGLIAENPFTSLLLCSCFPSRVIATDRSTISWCQHLATEWLAAVELGLLKGRHPLLKDIDVNINPSTGLALIEDRESNKSCTVNKLLTRLDALKGGSITSLKEMLEESDIAANVNSRTRRHPQRNFELQDRVQQENNSALQQTSSLDAELVKEEGVDPVDSERSQVLQTTQMVVNMLDATMPNSLTEEQKKKVLTAVGQGETLMNALQDAVPEDVRGKLTTAVSEILHNQRTNLKFDGLLSIDQIPNIASGLKSKIHEKVGGLSTAGGGNEDPHLSDHRKRINDPEDGSNNNQASTDKPSGELESEPQASENLQQAIDPGQFQSTSSHGNNISGSVRKGNEFENNNENAVFLGEKAPQSSGYGENGSETGPKPHDPSWSASSGDTEDLSINWHKVKQDGGMAQLNTKEESTIQQNEEKITDSSSEQNRMISSAKMEEVLSPPVSSSDTQMMEKEGSDNEKIEEKGMQLVLNQSNSDPPTFGVSQALDALTGMDDSTQVAVNSVFGVIEDMISQLEEEKDNEEVKVSNTVNDQKTGFVSENHRAIDDHELDKEGDNKIGMSLPSDMLDDLPLYDQMDSQNHARARWVEGKPVQHPISLGGNIIESSQENGTDGHIGKEENEKREHFDDRILLEENSNKIRCLNDIPLCITPNPYGDSLYNEYLRKYLISKMKNTKSLDLDTTTTLLLDYIPEEGQWKLLEQPGNTKDSIGDVATHEVVDRKVQAHSTSKENYSDNIIEPSYVILDTEKHHEPVGESGTVDKKNQKVEVGDDTLEESLCFVKDIILDSLKVEVGRRLTAADMKEMETNLARDLKHVENALSLALGQGKENVLFLEGKDRNSEKVGTLNGEHIIRATSFAVQETSYLRRVLPVGVIVGSSLAALRKFFIVAAVNGNGQHEAVILDQVNNSGDTNCVQVGETETDQMYSDNIDHNHGLDNSLSGDGEKTESKNLNNGTVMVGAVTAAVGASALLVHHKDSYKGNGTAVSLSKSFKERQKYPEPEKLEEDMSEKGQNNIVTSLAEKAMSVAGPVVPTNEDGEVDQKRLVAMLAEWGQKGGMLRLIGKVALLWGGIRGAMSLTDRLILFLHIAERPLFQRMIGFVFMVLVLWSPIVVPLLPTLVQSWATHSSNKISELVCIIGLYTSLMILVMLWGKRIRGYENPLEQYGLDLTSLPKIQSFLKGLTGGVMLVLAIHSVNSLLGFVHLSWPSTLSAPLDAVMWLKGCGQMLVLIGRGLITATGIALVEELVFRSWLPDEISVDLGYHRGIIISGLAFSLFERSLWAIPGLWLLSLSLAGARQRSQGSLSLPIGLRAGIMSSSFILQMGGFLTYQPNFPHWVTGTPLFQPFSGVTGIAFSLLLAIVLYPRQPLHQK